MLTRFTVTTQISVSDFLVCSWIYSHGKHFVHGIYIAKRRSGLEIQSATGYPQASQPIFPVDYGSLIITGILIIHLFTYSQHSCLRSNMHNDNREDTFTDTSKHCIPM